MKKAILNITTQGCVKDGLMSLFGEVKIKTENKSLQSFSSSLEKELEEKFGFMVLFNPRLSQTMNFKVRVYFNDIEIQKIELAEGEPTDFVSISVIIQEMIKTFKF